MSFFFTSPCQKKIAYNFFFNYLSIYDK
jgi:hypothetical protein